MDQNPAVGHPTAIRVPQVRRSPVEGEGRVLGHRRLWSVVNATYPELLVRQCLGQQIIGWSLTGMCSFLRLPPFFLPLSMSLIRSRCYPSSS